MSGDTLFYIFMIISYPVLGFLLYRAETSFKEAKNKRNKLLGNTNE